jgi:hypothetical protein
MHGRLRETTRSVEHFRRKPLAKSRFTHFCAISEARYPAGDDGRVTGKRRLAQCVAVWFGLVILFSGGATYKEVPLNPVHAEQNFEAHTWPPATAAHRLSAALRHGDKTKASGGVLARKHCNHADAY